MESAKITSVIRDKRGRLLYVKVGTNLFDMAQLLEFFKLGYSFYTSEHKDDTIKREVRPVKRGGRVYFATEPDWTKANNLDYLPQAELF